MLAANLILTCLIGLMWALLGSAVASYMAASRWPWQARAACVLLGLLAGLYRVEYAAWIYLYAPHQTFLSTEAALLTNLFTLVNAAILLGYIIAGRNRRRT